MKSKNLISEPIESIFLLNSFIKSDTKYLIRRIKDMFIIRLNTKEKFCILLTPKKIMNLDIKSKKVILKKLGSRKKIDIIFL